MSDLYMKLSLVTKEVKCTKDLYNRMWRLILWVTHSPMMMGGKRWITRRLYWLKMAPGPVRFLHNTIQYEKHDMGIGIGIGIAQAKHGMGINLRSCPAWFCLGSTICHAKYVRMGKIRLTYKHETVTCGFSVWAAILTNLKWYTK